MPTNITFKKNKKAPIGRLVTLKPGSYLLAPPRPDAFIKIHDETSALLLNAQGSNKDVSTLLHALVGKDVVLIWDDSCLLNYDVGAL